MFWLVASTIVASCMAVLMIFVRIKAAEKPVSVKKIILPPLFMSTGALMFLFEYFRVEWIQVLEAIGIGMIFSVFLIKTSKFEIRDKDIYLITSKSFAIILFGLLLIRVIFKLIIGSKIALGETGGIFYLLGFGMIFTWRIAMLYQYKQVERKLQQSNR